MESARRLFVKFRSKDKYVFEEEFTNDGREGSKASRFVETPLNATNQKVVAAKHMYKRITESR